jgi:double-stranded uracil-DNA glycosylase
MNQHSDRLMGLEPVIDSTCRVLIVGSFPSAISLQKGEYYANPRNDFWKIMEVVTDMTPGLPYQSKLSFLLSRGIGLWDVVSSCIRSGSADATIRDPAPAAIGSLLSQYNEIIAVFCNGRRAESGLVQALMSIPADDPLRSLHKGYLPSSSPAHAVRFEQKCKPWMAIRMFLIPDNS